MEDILREFKNITKIITQNGGKLYLVGGAARDMYLNRKPQDLDFCICNMTSEKFKDLFKEAIIIGKRFPVFKYKKHEFALARKEKKIGTTHKDFEFNTDVNITIEEDLKRRDITINSMALDMSTGEYIDIYGAKKDIDNHIIRATSDAFIEDANRVYRVARFAAKFEFEVDEKTINMISMMRDEMFNIPVEVVFTELRKALETNKPSLFFDVLRRANVLDVHFKEINNLIGVVQPIIYHKEGDVYNHTMKVIDIIAKKNNNPLLLYAALTHDLGKALTSKEMLPKHIGHDENGIILTHNLSNRLKVPKAYKKSAAFVCKNHMRFARFYEMRSSKKVDMIEAIKKSYITLEEMEILINADNSMVEGREYISFAEIGEKVLSKINGEYIFAKYAVLETEVEKFKQLLRDERIKYIKENLC